MLARSLCLIAILHDAPARLCARTGPETSPHETLLLDAGVPVHVVASRGGKDPAVLLRSYAKRTTKADTRVAEAIDALARAAAAVSDGDCSADWVQRWRCCQAVPDWVSRKCLILLRWKGGRVV